MNDSPYLPQYDPHLLQHKFWFAGYWQIVHDATPREEGGFMPGLVFPGNEFLGMVQLDSLAIGTRARCRGQVYTLIRSQILQREDGVLFRTNATQPASLRALDSYERSPREKTDACASVRNPTEVHPGFISLQQTRGRVPGEPVHDPPRGDR